MSKGHTNSSNRQFTFKLNTCSLVWRLLEWSLFPLHFFNWQHIFLSGIEGENKLMTTVGITPIFPKTHQVPCYTVTAIVQPNKILSFTWSWQWIKKKKKRERETGRISDLYSILHILNTKYLPESQQWNMIFWLINSLSWNMHITQAS